MPSHGPMASIITFINSWKSGEERRGILRRTRTGRLAIARKGGLLGGFTPYGYSYVAKTPHSLASLVIDDGQARIIRDIYRWLVQEKLSCRAVAQRLTEMGIPTPQGKSVWQPSVVNHMLRQEVYCGVMYFNRREPVKPQQHRAKARSSKTLKTSRKLRPQEEWIPIPVPAIIDRATWELAQEQLKANSHFSPRNNTRHAYLLRGLVRCGICGKAFSGATFKRREREYQYYICNQRNPTPGEEKCTARHIPLALLEKLVWDTVAGVMQDPRKLAEEYESRLHPSGHNDIVQERKRLEGEIKRLDNMVDRFLDLYGDAKFDRSQLDQKVDQVTNQRKAVLGQLQALDRRQQEETNQRYRWALLHE
jgi:site-specific DNA recombinase